MRIYFIYVTFGSLKEARNIGSKLVKNKLAACTNIIPTIYSTFVWKNQTKIEKECSMIIKTSKSKVKEAIKFIANDWKLKSNSKSIPVAYFFNDRRWSEVNKFGEKLSKYYPNISTLGREYDYELLRSHGLFNTQEGIQHRNFKNIRYIISYNSIPIRIRKSLISEIKIIGQLKIIKLLN